MEKQSTGIKRLVCIDVGSGALDMLAVETDGVRMRVIDTLRRSVALGRDSFSAGAIESGTIQATCQILNGFKQLMMEYGIDQCRVVATSAIREARNRDLVLDQIRLATGFEVNVLTNAQERFLTFKGLDEGVPDYRRMRREGMLLVDVGYGSTEISAMRGGELVLSRNVRLGALRLWELLSSIAGTNAHYPELLEDFIISNLDHIRAMVRLKDIVHCVVLSGEADQLLKLAGGRVTRKRFNQLYLDMKHMTPEQMQRSYQVRPDRAEILLPTMMVIKAFLDMTGAEALHLSTVALKEGVVADMRDKLFRPERESVYLADTVSLAWALAASQQADKKHAEDVRQKALMLFDELEVLHGMTARERLLLELAAILHDMGKGVSTYRHGQQSAHVLMANPLFGLSDEEMRMVALLCRHHSAWDETVSPEEGQGLSERQRVASLKLLAILRLADAMDKGHRQKLILRGVTLAPDGVEVSAVTDREARLEKWIFEQKAALFAEVFGLCARLKIRRVDLNG